nr:hypothetical protein GCM10020063_034240 [Dactylosporangium thailandense]
MSQTLDELLRALVAAGADIDEIEELVGDDPEGSRAAVWSYAGDEGMRLIGFLGDPRDFEFLAAHLADPQLRHTALEALANQPDAERADALARSLLDDADPRVRSRAAGMLAMPIPGSISRATACGMPEPAMARS